MWLLGLWRLSASTSGGISFDIVTCKKFSWDLLYIKAWSLHWSCATDSSWGCEGSESELGQRVVALLFQVTSGPLSAAHRRD
ncbi:hypothetical protein BKA83DRAFT_4398310 [Pisolithus microcarpus]|nr:hypothetical protein BKA83DRAFT_4398310 [Pisolithus microcarpus]